MEKDFKTMKYTIILKSARFDTILKKVNTNSVIKAENIYFQFCNFPSVRSNYNTCLLIVNSKTSLLELTKHKNKN